MKNLSLWMKILIGVLIVVVIATIGIFIYKAAKKDNFISVINNNEENEVLNVEVSNDINIYKGTERAVAVMIDNNKNAWPQYSLNQAYMVYEIIVEAGETRLMALFKGQDVDIVGPIRSSRHYFLDYALENDAIYAHLGWSPQAQSDISSLGVNNINGQYYDSGKARTSSSSYWRLSDRSAPHNAVANMAKLLEIAADKGYRTTSDKESVLNYVSTEVELTSDSAIEANTISIPYTSSNVVKYEYNAETKRYTRYSKGVKQTDASTGEDVTTKNIIITFAKNYTLNDTENKGRQGLNNIGTLDGYYITNGKAIKITCEKTSRNSQTVYKDLDGNEIQINDGNTFVQICPIDANVTIN